ncbi:MAG: hypothetical protein U0271_47395 [Polyangiaceae bacterium]
MLITLPVCVLLQACGDDSSTPSGGGGAGGTTASTGGAYDGGGTGDPTIVVGAFEIELDETEAPTIVGKVSDGPTPAQVVWEVASQSGDCTLMKPRVPFCSTSCGGSAACVEDETCQAYPTARSLGDVTVSGVSTTAGDTSVTMSPVAATYQVPAGTTLADPPFTAGDPIQLTTEGGYFSPFTIDAVGIEALTVSATSYDLARDTDLLLDWDASADSQASIHIKLDISHHGGTKGMIECDVADSGAATIDAVLVNALLDLGVAGYPTIVLTRQYVGSATIEVGRVDLRVTSDIERPVVIDGLLSCTDDSECTPPATCQTDLTCQ